MWKKKFALSLLYQAEQLRPLRSMHSLPQFLRENHVIDLLKKYLAVIAIFHCVWLSAQHNNKFPVRVGLKLGLLVHTLSGDLTESRPGVNALAGAWLQLKMDKKWTAQVELLLLDKGIGGTQGAKPPHYVNLHYLEIPILFQYHSNDLYFEFGPGMGYLINCAEHIYNNLAPDLLDTYPFSRSELSFNVGGGCSLNDKWSLGLRISHSILPVRSAVPSVSKESYNRLIALSVTRQLRRKKANEQEE